MTRGMIYKSIFILCLILFALTLIMPTVGEKEMEIDFLEAVTQEDKDFIKKRFESSEYAISEKNAKVYITGTNLTDAIMNEVRVYKGVRNAKIMKHWAEDFVLAKKINLGLDLQGGMHLVLRANFEKIEKKMGKILDEKDKNEITQQALELLRNRIDKFGVSEPSIRPRGAEAIEIQLPGVKDPKGVKKAIGTTGRVEYRLVDDKYSKLATAWLKENFKEEKIPVDKLKLDDLTSKIEEGIKIPKTFEVLYFYSRGKDTKKNISGLSNGS